MIMVLKGASRLVELSVRMEQEGSEKKPPVLVMKPGHIVMPGSAKQLWSEGSHLPAVKLVSQCVFLPI